MKNLSTLNSLPEILQCEEDFQQHFEKIDKLQLVLNAINHDLTALEGNVELSEAQLGLNSSVSLKTFFKPWLALAGASQSTRPDEGAAELQAPIHNLTFKSSDYFGDTVKDESEA